MNPRFENLFAHSKVSLLKPNNADHIYNAYQTGLFNNKLPNRIYIDKEEQDYRGI